MQEQYLNVQEQLSNKAQESIKEKNSEDEQQIHNFVIVNKTPLQICEQKKQNQQSKLKELSLINKQLIKKLKKLNQELAKLILNRKNKLISNKDKSNRSLTIDPDNSKEGIKKQLSNAYKQIDQYKKVIQKIKFNYSIEDQQKINALQNKLKNEDQNIFQLQNQIAFNLKQREQQQKQLLIYDNQSVTIKIKDLDKQAENLREKIKNIKKYITKSDQIAQKQQKYQIQLQIARRKLLGEYYVLQKEQKIQINTSNVPQKQWDQLNFKLQELRKNHEQSNKKIMNLLRIKYKQLQAFTENDLKLKQKFRIVAHCKNKIEQLTKLATQKKKNTNINLISISKTQNILSKIEQRTEKQKKVERQIKKWAVPTGYCMEFGKMSSDSLFFSDKFLLKDIIKKKIIEINIWTQSNGMPCIIQFYYKDQNFNKIQGSQPIDPVPNNLSKHVFQMKMNDYLQSIQGIFIEQQLCSISFRSKQGVVVMFQDRIKRQQNGMKFIFKGKNGEDPCCMFGAYRILNNTIRVSYIGCQFQAKL